ncbi:hypothetical protein CcaverHIS002_0700620 [Cutaneotrichosporon cavernicola]|nr:hypothetical protein CcaverHIS002_0700620 [Cutaneotrichosporon cavernicola]
MGIFLPSSPVALQPVHPPVAVFPAFISQGPVTLVLREQIFSLSGDDFSVKDAATGKTVVRCKGKVVSFRDRKMGTKMTATFRNANTGENAELSMRGDMFGLGTTIVLNGNIPVAQISRKLLHMREWIADKQTYYVTVAPGVDLALIAALCIAFDEVKNEKKE